MLKKTLLASLLTCLALTAQDVVFSNKAIEVTVTPKTGRYTVLDKRTKRVWEQPDTGQIYSANAIPCPKLPTKQPSYTIKHTMLGDAAKVSSASDCSATFTIAWEPQYLVIVANVKDDVFIPATPPNAWWYNDSIELWINNDQFGVYTIPGKTTKVHSRNQKPLAASTCTTEKTDTGYKATIKLQFKEIGLQPKQDGTFFFALGVNDADVKDTRDGQIYFPETWKHSTPSTFNPVVLTAPNVLKLKKAPSINAFSNIKKINQGITYTWKRFGEITLNVKAEIVGDLPELKFTIAAEDPKATLSKNVSDIPGFVMEEETAGLAIADYSSGHFYPLAEEPFLRTAYPTSNDLPFIAVSDLKSGQGYGLYVDTPDDGQWYMDKVKLENGRTTRVPRVAWLPSHRAFGAEPRSYRFHFLNKGGYVAAAKVWRKWAKDNGYLVTLKEKAKHNPNVFRLMGSSDIWGGNSINFIRAAYAEGIEKLLINGPMMAEQMKEAIGYGYLPGKYDIYTDVWENVRDPKLIDHRSAPLPEHAVRNADGSTKTAWATFDKKRVSLKRCTAVMLDAAKIVCPRDLAKTPYLARFLDVTTAEGLYECYHPDHPMTRKDKRIYSEGMCRYFGHWDRDCLNLVAGGEHGKWWAAKYLHYVEGMQSGANYSWPAGYLKRPTNKFMDPRNPDKPTNRFIDRYEVFGIGPKYRVPLWDLALHDCITTTWYWGDSTDYLMQAAPETISRKDAFNVLHASMPTFWISQGTWTHDRSSFLRSYFHTTKVHELVGMEEMTNHQFLNQERTLHKTTYGDGTEIVVNMDNHLHTITLKEKKYVLPPNGFAVDGPKLKQHLIYKDALFQSQVITDDFFFATTSNDLNPHPNGKSSLISMLRVKKITPEHVTFTVKGDASIQIPQDFFKNWNWDNTIFYKLNDAGIRESVIKPELKDGNLVMPKPGSYELLTGKTGTQPDFSFGKISFDLKAKQPLSVVVNNSGLLASKGTLCVYRDRIAPENLIAKQETASIKPSASQTITLALPMDKLAGHHLVYVKVEPKDGTELTPHNNESSQKLSFPFKPELWQFVIDVKLPVAKVNSKLEPVDIPVDFTKLLKPGQTISPRSIRVGRKTNDGIELLDYAQFTPDKDFNPQSRAKGTVSIAVDTIAGEAISLQIFASSKDMFAPGGAYFVPGPKRGSGSFSTATYYINFIDATPRDLQPGSDFGGGPDFLTNLLVSSAVSGWAVEQDAVINRFDVLVNGPAKTVVNANVTLSSGATYDKIYTLTPGRIVIDINLSKPAGSNYTRGFYTLPGEYADSNGHHVYMDGTLNAGNIAGKCPNPKWFAIKGDKWAKSCVALSKGFDNISFWDNRSPSHGQLGFTASKQFKNLKVVYFVHGQQPDFNFAEHDYKRAHAPLK